MAYHLQLHWPVQLRCAAGLARMGWMGVDIFFALSGFLITRILLRLEPSFRGLLSFYRNRALRIWPLYFCLLALFWCELRWTHAPYPLLRCAFFVQNYLPRFWYPHNFDQTWSLCVEEHFYLVWPVLVLLLPRAGLPWVLLSVLAACPTLRWAAGEHGVSPKLLYTASQYRLDSIALGALIACVQSSPLALSQARLRKGGIALFAAGAPALAWFWWHSSGGLANSPAYLCLALVSGSSVSIAIATAGTHTGAVLAARPLRYIGTISYGLYMIHPFVFAAAGRKAQNFAGLAAALLLSFLLASASWHFLERPILAFRTTILAPAHRTERGVSCSMPIEVKHLDSGTAVVTVSGRLVIGQDEQRLEAVTAELLQQGRKKFVFDISALDYADSSGIGTMVACLTRIKQTNGDLRIAGANPRMLRLFKMTGVVSLMPFYPTVAAASE